MISTILYFIKWESIGLPCITCGCGAETKCQAAFTLDQTLRGTTGRLATERELRNMPHDRRASVNVTCTWSNLHMPSQQLLSNTRRRH